MSETVIADFVARFSLDTRESLEPVRGRIVLSQKRLVLAESGSKTTIPLRSIFDISVGHVPSDLEGFFQDTVTVAYEADDGRHTAVIEAKNDNVGKFKVFLFKAILSGTPVTVKHPARVGGRVTDQGFETGKLRIQSGSVEFLGIPDPFAVDLSGVSYFQKQDRDVGGTTRTVVAIRHADNGQTVTSEFVVAADRKLNLLGRYLRLEYAEISQQAERIDVTEQEMEALVAIYSGANSGNFAGALGIDAGSASMVLTEIEKKGLVNPANDGLSLTPPAKMIVSDRIEKVNT
ncbi:CheF family chemotaxis protein [Haladaptatus sp. AB618]|uniref:CheF family chemotaxis protein n=1 Tax=Haladaptatus sp. AB618 TaxID=2934173 RepID=UPI00209BC398|nr:CheF family chemotaxis protein [Haladaptatus sp. AB618]MCO8253390.1 CheF family chemotaxis protein [Haladaptatus sp. AB618]